MLLKFIGIRLPLPTILSVRLTAVVYLFKLPLLPEGIRVANLSERGFKDTTLYPSFKKSTEHSRLPYPIGGIRCI